MDRHRHITAREVGSWRDAIATGATTFLVGAGISAPAPSRLPLAGGLVAALLDPLVQATALPADLARSVVGSLAELRPEVIVDVLVEHLGIRAVHPLMTVLRGRPNGWHRLLATALAAGCCVVTTNFDTLIEEACARRGTKMTRFVVGPPRGFRLDGGARPRSVLFKVHGTVGDAAARYSLALAVRQVGRRMTARRLALLRLLVADRPLIVLGYSGRDEFDILPALLSIRRTAGALWVIHDPRMPPQPLRASGRRRLDAQPAVAAARAWPGRVQLVVGDSARMLALLRPRRGPATAAAAETPREGRWRPADPGLPRWTIHPAAAAVALVYGLVERRAFALAERVVEHVGHDRRLAAAPALLLAHAVALEKGGTDLRAAQAVASRAVRAAAVAGSPRLHALALDQSGVVARRRGRYRQALRLYDRALALARESACPQWLVVQVRSHRAVALDYLKRRRASLREHRAVASYEKRTGDLRGYAKSLNNIGLVHLNEGRWDAALESLAASCALKEQLGDARGIAQSFHNIGKTHYLRRDLAGAESSFLASLRLRLGSARDKHGAAQSYVALAHVALASARPDDARRYANLALAAHRAYGDSHGEAQARAILRSLR